MKFLIVPADLEPNELIVYSWLYKHSNQTKENYEGLFKNEVYCSSRIISNYIKMSQPTVTRSLKKLQEQNYIKFIFKSKSSKQHSKYFLTFNESLKESVSESECESVSESVEDVEITNVEGDSKSVGESVSESVSESDDESLSNNNLIIKSNNKSNIYTEIFDFYMSLDLVKHRNGLTPAMKDAIKKAKDKNKYTVEQMKDLLFRHNEKVKETKDKGKYSVKKRKLDEFFGQKIQGATSLICTQYEEGGKYYKETVINEKEVENENLIPREEEW